MNRIALAIIAITAILTLVSLIFTEDIDEPVPFQIPITIGDTNDTQR